MSIVGDAAQAVMKKAVQLAPDSWIPGGRPDPLITHKHGLIGAPVSRIDGPLKVRGAARFAAEFTPDGMLHAALAFGTVARGRIASLDTAAAEAAPGVVLVMTHRNAPRMAPMPAFGSSQLAAGGDDLPVMQDDRIHWNGQPVALVLAETLEQAEHAASLVAAEYEAAPATTALAAAKAAGSETGLFMGEPLALEIGDAEAALAAAAHRVDAVY
ncbi:MAG: xanthine dehydrogenase family protein molybdopterin-binding subunit, partial [Gluconacetobacter diazotrophicus]|nr:xanthine dehydrogenase family protein molybdopterin-binding subunit [Gluconacetobacter diazotrophicus]